jgi:nicotinamide riboside kinase
VITPAVVAAWFAAHWLELFGALTGAISVWLAVRENVWNWWVGIVNNAVYLIVFFEGRLFGDASLQVFYIAISVYGIVRWLHGGDRGGAAPVRRIGAAEAALLAVALLAATFGLQRYFPPALLRSAPRCGAAARRVHHCGEHRRAVHARPQVPRELAGLDRRRCRLDLSLRVEGTAADGGALRTLSRDVHRRLRPMAGNSARAGVRVTAPYDDVPRLVLAGAESTGKTTLARTLAEHFGVPWVAEYGREYTEEKYRDGMLTDAWEPAEFLHIAREQIRREDAAASTHPPLVVADTDAFATRLWYERYLGAPPAEAEWPRDHGRERIYLVPEPDVAFVADAIRDGEQFRIWMHERTLADLAALGREVRVLSGDYAARTRTAIAFVNERFDLRR